MRNVLNTNSLPKPLRDRYAAYRALDRYFASPAWRRSRNSEQWVLEQLADARAAADALEAYWHDTSYGHAATLAAACEGSNSNITQDSAA